MSERGQCGGRRDRKNPSALATRLKLKSAIRQSLTEPSSGLTLTIVIVEGEVPNQLGDSGWMVDGRAVTREELAIFLATERGGKQFELSFLRNGKRLTALAKVPE